DIQKTTILEEASFDVQEILHSILVLPVDGFFLEFSNLNFRRRGWCSERSDRRGGGRGRGHAGRAKHKFHTNNEDRCERTLFLPGSHAGGLFDLVHGQRISKNDSQ